MNIVLTHVMNDSTRETKVTSNFIAGRPKAALLCWFFGSSRYGVWSCFVILVKY